MPLSEEEIFETYYEEFRHRYPKDEMPEFKELSFEQKRLLKNSVSFSVWQLERIKKNIKHEIKMYCNKVILVNKKKP